MSLYTDMTEHELVAYIASRAGGDGFGEYHAAASRAAHAELLRRHAEATRRSASTVRTLTSWVIALTVVLVALTVALVALTASLD